jgi:DNA repair/transcription protein MET18/MMS19
MSIFPLAFITRYTVSKTIPHLIQLFRDPAEVSNRPATLAALETIIRALCNVFTPRSSADTARSYEEEKPLDRFKDEILGVFTVGLKTDNSTSSALMGLDAMVKMYGLLANDELGYVVHSINEVLTGSQESSSDIW